MKVEGPGAIRPPTLRRAGKRAGAGGDFAGELSATEAQAATVSGTAPLAAVDAVLALQEVPDATEGARRAVRHGADMLERLDDIRHGLLLGTVPREKLKALVEMVQSRRERADDPRLAAILDEIELRAAVELAKLGQLDKV